MTATPLTFWHARILLLMTPEPQSITDVATQLATQGKTLRISRLDAIFEDLKNRELLGYSPQRGSVESQYWLKSGVLVEDALHEAYTIVTARQGSAHREP